MPNQPTEISSNINQPGMIRAPRLVKWLTRLTTSLTIIKLDVDADQSWSNIPHLERGNHIQKLLHRSLRLLEDYFDGVFTEKSILSAYSKSTSEFPGETPATENSGYERAISKKNHI